MGHVLPAIFWFVLLALVLLETLIVGFSNWQTTSPAVSARRRCPSHSMGRSQRPVPVFGSPRKRFVEAIPKAADGTNHDRVCRVYLNFLS